MNRTLDVASSYASSAARLGAGLRVGSIGPRPQQRLKLFEFEACPFCRKVREALTALDLEAEIYPCPKGGTRFRPEAIQRGGRAMFPFLVDPNQHVQLYESDDIIAHLYKHYGAGRPPISLTLGPVTQLRSMAASVWRLGIGSQSVTPSTAPPAPLELWSFEASPYSRIAREALCSLEIPYVLHNVAKGSPSRAAFVETSGKMQVPFLVDPNRTVRMFESADIVQYLHAAYGPGSTAQA